MHAVTLCLSLLALVCCASFLARLVRIPLPFLQIAVGIVAALPPISLQATLDPATFLLLFIPPLLFGDGWLMPRRELLALRWPVLGLSVGLVLATVAVAGPALHWLIPSMPLSVAFAVAALVSPTDAVALSAITEHIPVPRRLMHLLESEALLNDASGLVAMRVAVGATLSGAFAPAHAAGAFVLVAAGGLAIGWLLTLGYARLHRAFLGHARDATLQTVLVALLPFAAYGLAEHLGVSGILAAVAAGMAASRVSLLESAHFTARLQVDTAWRVGAFCLNGVIFVLLGLQLPDIFGHGPVGIDLIASPARGSILGEVVALTALLVVLRLAWVLGSEALAWLTRGERVGGWRVIAAASLGGVRGAVTLAGALSLPLMLPGGTPFPSRDLAITLATGVILLSMLIAASALPLLRRHGGADAHAPGAEEHAARIAALEAAVRTIGGREPGPQADRLVASYRARITRLGEQAPADLPGEDGAWRELHRTALHAERAAVQRMRFAGRLDDVTARRILSELDLIEAAAMQRPPVIGAADA